MRFFPLKHLPRRNHKALGVFAGRFVEIRDSPQECPEALMYYILRSFRGVTLVSRSQRAQVVGYVDWLR
jgi:hypothetical protein